MFVHSQSEIDFATWSSFPKSLQRQGDLLKSFVTIKFKSVSMFTAPTNGTKFKLASNM